MRVGKIAVLSVRDRRRLQAISKSAEEKSRIGARATVLLLSDKGMSSREISNTFGLTDRAVRKIRRRWRKSGFKGLQDMKRSGRPPIVSQKYMRLLVATVEKDPKELGYAFRRWTVPRLAEYLKQKTGIEVTTRWVTELLHKQGFVWRRTKQTTRNLQNKSEVLIAKRRLERLKKGLYKGMQTTSSGMLTE